jgi:hypothetical protein
MPCHAHSIGASQQQAARYDVTWQVAGFNQRFPRDSRLARMPIEAPSTEEIRKEGQLGWRRSVDTGSKGVHHPTGVNLMTGMSTRRVLAQEGSHRYAWMLSAQPGGKAIAVRRTRWLRWRPLTSAPSLLSPG